MIATTGSATTGDPQHEARASRRAAVLLELDRARARRRAGRLGVRPPSSMPVPPHRPDTAVELTAAASPGAAPA